MILKCKECGRLATDIEANLRKFNEGKCADCGGELEPERKTRTISSVTMDPVTYEYVHSRLKAADLLKVVSDDRGRSVILLDAIAFEKEPDRIELTGGAFIERVQVEDPELLRKLARESWAAVMEIARDRDALRERLVALEKQYDVAAEDRLHLDPGDDGADKFNQPAEGTDLVVPTLVISAPPNPPKEGT